MGLWCAAMKTRYCIVLLLPFAFDIGQAQAAAQIEREEALMLEATAKSMKRDFRGAEDLYTRAIDANNNSIDGYLQRATMRRALNNPKGMEADATRARALIDTALSQNANNGDLYYQRSVADRMLKDFDAAERDLQAAIRLGKRGNFDTDFKAIEVERKMAQ